jgi:hypothetical protein
MSDAGDRKHLCCECGNYCDCEYAADECDACSDCCYEDWDNIDDDEEDVDAVS